MHCNYTYQPITANRLIRIFKSSGLERRGHEQLRNCFIDRPTWAKVEVDIAMVAMVVVSMVFTTLVVAMVMKVMGLPG